MSNPHTAAVSSLSDFNTIKQTLVRDHGCSDFEIDFELRFALFLAGIIDGETNASERAFLDAAYTFLNWSGTYQGLLQSRIDKLPSYDFSQLRTAKTQATLAAAILKATYALALCDRPLSQDEQILLTNFADTTLSKYKGKVTQTEADVLGIFKRDEPKLFEIVTEQTPEDLAEEDNSTLEDELAKLNALVGLKGVKDEIEKLVYFLEIQKQRQGHQLKAAALSLHLVFSGNPGTGKTTVARILASIFKKLQILKKGHLVETDRMGLVGQYVGHTAKKTSEIIDSALDGVLFIDEAYSLVGGGENDFGGEAIDTLVKRMEDDRDRLIVIVAGYPKDMEEFIQTNPGLKSRFSKTIHFSDYAPEELGKILDIFCKSNQYELSADAKEKLKQVFEYALANTGDDFGNGRYVRNLFEQIIRNQALRLRQQKKELSKQELITLEAADIVLPK